MCARVREEARARLTADQQEAAQLAGRLQQLQQRDQQDLDQCRRLLETLQHKDEQLMEAVSRATNAEIVYSPQPAPD